jgi:hypothetical protein
MSLEDIEKRLSAFKEKNPQKNPGSKRNIGEKKSEPILEKVFEIEEEFEDDHRWLKKILLMGSGLAILIVGFGLFFILSYTSTSRDVNLEIYSVKEVSRGAPFNVDVSVTNNSGGLIKNVVLTLNLPSGLISPNSARDRNFVTENIGDIVSGNLIKRSFSLVPIDSIGSKEAITAVLSYAIATGARFENREIQSVAIKDSALEMEIKKPDQILSGSNFSFDINYKNGSDFNFPGLTLEADYPNAFKFDSASIPPASLNNYWQLGGLSGDNKGTLSISGHLDSGAGSGVEIPVKISASFGGEDYPIAEGTIGLVPAASPLLLQILVNKQSDYVARIGDALNYSVQYRNSSGIALANAKIKAILTGSILDMTTLKTGGAFDPSTQTLNWDSSNLPVLKMIDPGASGEVDFQVNLKKSFNIQHLNDKNFSIRLNATMDSPSVPYYLSATRTSVSSVVDTKISGSVLVAAQGFFNEVDGGPTNKGNLPPKVGQATQYTIHWLIKNLATDINNVEVKATLAPGVKWVGGISANLGNVPTYNPGDNQVVWNIDRLAATKGVLSDPAEAVFQIEATPNETMVGMPEPLIKTTYLEAVDNFTGATLSGQSIPVTTMMLDDAVSAIESIVVR